MARKRGKKGGDKSAQKALSILLLAVLIWLCGLSFGLAWSSESGREAWTETADRLCGAAAGWAQSAVAKLGLPDSWTKLLAQLGLAEGTVPGVPEEVLKDGDALHFIDVGQADATLVASKGQYCLVDAGDFDSEPAITAYLDALGVTKLDYVVMTHPHADHIGSMDDILKRYEVGMILLPDFSKAPLSTSAIFERVLAVTEEKNIPAETVRAGAEYPLGSGVLRVLDTGVETTNYNDLSPVIRFELESVSLVCSGDGEEPVETRVLASAGNLRADVFQAGHHGSSTSNTLPFLLAIRPEITVVSCGEGNSYGHPHDEMLSNAALVASKVYRTDRQGDIVVFRDANGLQACTRRSGAAAAPAA